MKPVVAFDVDGVLLPYKPDFEINPEHGRWMRELAEHADLVWATSWAHQANTDLTPLLGIPHLPVVRKSEIPYHGLPRPLVWLDDMFHGFVPANVGEAVHATRRDVLYIGPDPKVGWTAADFAAIKTWINGLSPSGQAPFAEQTTPDDARADHEGIPDA